MRITSITPKLHHELTLLSPRHSHLQQSLTPGSYHNSYLAAEVLLLFQKAARGRIYIKEEIQKGKTKVSESRGEWPRKQATQITNTQPGFKFQTERSIKKMDVAAQDTQQPVLQDSHTRLKT